MPSDDHQIRFLLDEHYPGWLAEGLSADGIDAVALTAHRQGLRGAIDAVALTAHRQGLRGADDGRVLQAAAAEGRIVVTEDVSTFAVAAAFVPDHVGIVYCHHARFPRTRPGLEKLRKALSGLAADPPAGLGEHPIIWWLS